MKKRWGSKTSLELGRHHAPNLTRQPPLIALPNYMKSTTSCDARSEEANVRSSKKVTKTLACPYSRCSLNGHVHALLPPFKSFVSARRRAIKTERSIKQRCQSPKAGGSQNCAKLIGRDEAATSNGKVEVPDDRLGDLFDEESLNSDTLFTSDKTTMSMDGEEHESLPTREMRNQAPQLLDGPAEETTTTLVDGPAEETTTTLVDGPAEETTTTLVDCKVIKLDQDHVENECNNFNEVSTTNQPYPEFSRKNSSEAECNTVHEESPRNMEDQDSIQATLKSGDEAMCFNPSEVHYLPLEPDTEAEKVDLRHQELDARKNAEEWMVDYALREAVTKIVPARHRKVASLVEAFERVVPTTKT